MEILQFAGLGLVTGLIFYWFQYQSGYQLIYSPGRKPTSHIEPNQLTNFQHGYGQTLSVITWNIQKLPWITKSVSCLSDLLDKYDIILLQECFMVQIQTLKNLFPTYWISKGFLSGPKLLNSGLVILSKYPIVQVQFYPFENSNPYTSDYLCEKGILVARVYIGGEYLYVVNTHLQASHYSPYDPVALEQFAELEKIIRIIKKNKYLIAGDFNIDPNVLIKHFPHINPISPNTPTIYINFQTGNSQSVPADAHTPLTYDYFISNLQITKPKVAYTTYSDHLPVHCKTKLN